MIKVRSIKKTFLYPAEIEILSNVTFDVKEGEILAIVGPSGSGKSTLLNIIGSLEAPTAGEVLLHEQNIQEISPPLYRQKHVGFIFQSFYLLEDSTSLENLLLPASIARESIKKGSSAYERALELLGHVDLLHRKDFPSKLLSGGEKQRIAIARALMNDPSLILADEPTGNLDAKNGRILMDLLFNTCKNYGKSMILVTHDLELAKLADRTLTLQEGKIV